jgi:GT2 family glycosyltransferase
MRDDDFSGTREVDWLMGSAFMTTREAIDCVGMLDERLFHYMSDVEWPRRFWYHGLAVSYCPGARMYHYHQRESKGRLGIFDILTRKQTRWHLRDAWRYFRRNGFRGIRPAAA